MTRIIFIETKLHITIIIGKIIKYKLLGNKLADNLVAFVSSLYRLAWLPIGYHGIMLCLYAFCSEIKMMIIIIIISYLFSCGTEITNIFYLPLCRSLDRSKACMLGLNAIYLIGEKQNIVPFRCSLVDVVSGISTCHFRKPTSSHGASVAMA